MKKLLLMIMSLAMVLSGITVPVSAADTVPIDGFKFVDIAYNGAGTYVALGKDKNYYSHIYTSTDGGNTWARSTNLNTTTSSDFTYAGVISGNPKSQQQLVYWADKGVFVTKSNKVTLVSEDGLTWHPNANVFWRANTMMTAEGGQLIYSGGAENETSMEVTDSLTENKFSANKLTINNTKNYSKIVAAKPVDENGDIVVYTAGEGACYDLKINNTTGKYYTSGIVSNSGNSKATPYDCVYAKGADQFLAIDGSEELEVIKNSQNIANYVIAEGKNVTAVGASDDYIVLGMSDGSMYYTYNEEVTEGTIWMPINAKAGTTACTEPVKGFAFSDNENFVALSDTQIYKGNVIEYCNIKEIVAEPTPVPTAEPTPEPTATPVPEVKLGDVTAKAYNPFEGVRLIGGTYSATLNKYVVYGDTAAADAEGRYWGKIFVSEDGTNWRDVYTGYTFSQRNASGSYTEVRNGAVWWEEQGHFIVSASTKDHSGVSLVSTDGENWKAIQPKGNQDADGNPTPELDTDFRLNTDITVSNGKLYTTNNGRQFRTYTAWNKASMEWFGVTNIPNTWYPNQLSVSGDEDPAVLIAQNGNGAVRNNESTATTELEKWTQVNAFAGSGAVTDSVFSKNLNKFVAVSNTGLRTSIVAKDGTLVQGPVVKDGGVCNAIDTNDEVFMMAGKDGNVYTAPDSEEFKNGLPLNVVPKSAATPAENTMNVLNVFKAGNKFIAVASDNTNSDVLLIAKNTSGEYEYTKASDAVSKAEFKPGAVIDIKMNCQNTTAEDLSFDMIIAVYTDDRLAQIKRGRKVLPAGTTAAEVSEQIALNENLPSNAVMKVYLWDSVNAMDSLKSVTELF